MTMPRMPAVVATLATLACAVPGMLVAASPPTVPLVSQKSTLWCWSASAEMVLGSLGTTGVSQGQQAERLYGLNQGHCAANLCTDDYTLQECNRTGFPQFYKYGFDAEVTRPLAHLSWEALAAALECQPVAFAWENLDEQGMLTGNGHMVVFAAAAVVTLPLPDGCKLPLGPLLFVNDPLSVLNAGSCHGDRRVQTYADYRQYAPWIHYYEFRPRGEAFAGCTGAEDSASSSALPPAPVFGVLESFDPDRLVDQFVDLINASQEAEAENGVTVAALDWLFNGAGLDGRGAWSCGDAIVEEAVTISALQSATDRDTLGDLVFDTGRRRYLCSQGETVGFSVEVAQVQPEIWRIATLGDTTLAGAVEAAKKQPGVAAKIREVYVQGLDLKLLRDPGETPHRVVIPLSPVPGLEEPLAGAPVSESELLMVLRSAARSFVSNGPS